MNQRTPGSTLTAAIAACAGLGLLASAGALAQNALGDGRALDANLRVGSGGRNEVGRDFRSELEFRNALVTGNVAGGMAFRGEVGYTAADDFRGTLGSNDNFRFERDSFYSGLATRNLTGLESLQSSLTYSVAGQSMASFGGPLIVNRSGAGISAGEITGAAPQNVRTDVFGNIAGSMRSPSLQALRAADRAELIAYSTPEGAEPVVIGASSLLGVKALPASSPVFNSTRRAQADLPELSNIPRAPDLSVDPSRRDPVLTDPSLTDPLLAPRPADESEDAEPRPNAVSVHQRILNDIEANPRRVEMTAQASRAEPTTALGQPQPGQPTSADASDAQPGGQPGASTASIRGTLPEIDLLRQVLARRAAASAAIELPGVGEPIDPLDPEATDPGARDEEQSQAPKRATEPDTRSLARQILDVELPPIDHLVNPETSNDVYRRHMTRGQVLLGEAHWFLAEERFTAAIAIVPGDPMAAAGRVHAQIGAGMFLSAGVNLRNLLRAYPEFIAVRYDEKLLPRGDRLDVLYRQLRQRAELDTAVGRDAAFLLAYLGHQYDQPEVVSEGLKKLDRIVNALGLEPDPLNDAVKGVWIEEEP